MDNHEEEKESLIEKSFVAEAITQKNPTTTDKYGITFDGKTYSVDGRKFDEYRYALLSIGLNGNQDVMDKYGITFDGKTWNVNGRKFDAYRYALQSVKDNPSSMRFFEGLIGVIALAVGIFVSIVPMLLIAFAMLVVYAMKVKD